jgi:hypothetical protein
MGSTSLPPKTLEHKRALEGLSQQFFAQLHNNHSPAAHKHPSPISPSGQEDETDPGSDSCSLLRNWFLVTSSPYVNPLPPNASQFSRWSPDTPHPFPWVQSSFPGSLQSLGSLILGRVMSPSVITYPLGTAEGIVPGQWAEHICLSLLKPSSSG